MAQHLFRGADANPVGAQNSWVSLLSCVGNAYVDLQKVASELELLFDNQSPNGFLPLFNFNLEEEEIPKIHSLMDLAAPPIHGIALWHIYRNHPDKKAALKILLKFYPKVISYHQYLYEYRDADEDGLVSIYHPWECPDWRLIDWPEDPSINIIEPFFNSLLIWSNESLLKLGSLLKKELDHVIYWLELGIYSMNEKLWQPSLSKYHAFDVQSSEFIATNYLNPIMPMIAEVPTQDQAERMLKKLRFAELSKNPDRECQSAPVQLRNVLDAMERTEAL